MCPRCLKYVAYITHNIMYKTIDLKKNIKVLSNCTDIDWKYVKGKLAMLHFLAGSINHFTSFVVQSE